MFTKQERVNFYKPGAILPPNYFKFTKVESFLEDISKTRKNLLNYVIERIDTEQTNVLEEVHSVWFGEQLSLSLLYAKLLEAFETGEIIDSDVVYDFPQLYGFRVFEEYHPKFFNTKQKIREVRIAFLGPAESIYCYRKN